MLRTRFGILIFAVALVSGAAVAGAQPFGRFGYAALPDVPGFSLTRSGFGANHPMADVLRFPRESLVARPVVTSMREQVVVLSERAGQPSKIRVNLLESGFETFFPNGIDLRIGSTTAPFLTWSEGSVTRGVPVPDVPWVLLSFNTAQPALLIRFQESSGPLQITGRPGDWRLQQFGFRGWVRWVLPLGLEARTAGTAATLGQLLLDSGEAIKETQGPPPVLLSQSVDADSSSVRVTWRFSRRNVLVPPALILARFAGYRAQIESPIRPSRTSSEYGPGYRTVGTELSVRFPALRIPSGRSLAVGAIVPNPPATVAFQDVPSVSELALEVLTGGRDPQVAALGHSVFSEFLSTASTFEEPNSKSRHPFNEAGYGLDQTGAHALLAQALQSALQPTSEANSLLSSLEWRSDWITWQVWCNNRRVGRRAAALASIAAALCPEPERRLYGAMLQAGLAAERGLITWRERRGLDVGNLSRIEPFQGIRSVVYGSEPLPTADARFGLSLLSPFRVYGEPAVAIRREPSGEFQLSWRAVSARANTLLVATAAIGQFRPARNITTFEVEDSLGLARLTYAPEVAGEVAVRLAMPQGAPLPGNAAPVPRYSETEVN